MALDDWSDIASPASSGSDDWSSLASPVGEKPKKQNKGILADIGTGLKRGVEQIPGMLTGIGDIVASPVSAVTGITRPVSRAADYVGEQTGFQPGKWAEKAAEEYSPEMQASLRNVEQADGFLPTIGAIAKNPRAAVNLVAESLPSTVAGGIFARGAMGAVAGAERLAAMKAAGDTAGLLKAGAIAGGIGEGAVTAGQQMAQTDYNVDPLKAAGAAVGAGALTGIIGAGSGRLAAKIGLPDVDSAIAAGTLGPGVKAGAKEYAKRIGVGAVQEGLLEEAPQSYQEQVWQNLANGKPWNEGAASAAAQGAVAGGVMGAGVNALPRSAEQPEAKPVVPPIVPPPKESITLTTDPAPLQGRIDSLLGIGSSPMNDAQKTQYAKDLEAAFGEVVGYAAGKDGLETPVTMEDYLRSTIAASDITRDRPKAEAANASAASSLQQIADEEATQQPDIAPPVYTAPEIPVVGPLSAAANIAVQTGAHQQAVQNSQAEAVSTKPGKAGTPSTGNREAAPQAGILAGIAAQAPSIAPTAQNTKPQGQAGMPAGVQQNAAAPARAASNGGSANVASPEQVAQKAPQANAPKVGPQPAAAPAAGQGQGIDLSNRTDAQLNFLSQRGLNGHKEAAIAEIARRRGEVAAPKASTIPEVAPGQSAQQQPAKGAENGQAETEVLNKPGAVLSNAAPATKSDSSLNRDSSWVIRDKETGRVVMETFDKNKVDALNTKKYEAVPIKEYLGSLNSKNHGNQNTIKNEAPASASAPASNPKPSRNKIDPAKDSLFQAIAKLGGMDTDYLTFNGVDINDITRESAARVSKKTGALGKKRRMPISFGFAMPLHKKGGASGDSMRETLSQYGYFPEGSTERDFLDAFMQELGGERVFTAEAQSRMAEDNAEAYNEHMANEQARIDAEAEIEAQIDAEVGYDDLSFAEQQIADQYADIAFEEVSGGKESTIAGMRALGFTEDEINAELEKNRRDQEAVQGNGQGQGQESRPDRNGEGAPDGRRDGEAGQEAFGLTQQTNDQAAEQFAQQQAAEPAEPTKEQADRERDAVPFSLGMQSQPKPQGVQTGLFTADGRASEDAKQAPADQPKPARTDKIGSGAEKSSLEEYLSEEPRDRNALNVTVEFRQTDGTTLKGPRHVHIEAAVRDGHSVILTKSGPALVDKNMRGWNKDDLGAAGMSYANWLVSKRDAQPKPASEPAKAQKPAAKELTAEQKIRAAFNALPSITMDKLYPITVEHNGVTREFIAYQQSIGRGNNKSVIHLATVKRGKLIASDDSGAIVNTFTLDGKDNLKETGMPRYATSEDMKQWNDAGFKNPMGDKSAVVDSEAKPKSTKAIKPPKTETTGDMHQSLKKSGYERGTLPMNNREIRVGLNMDAPFSDQRFEAVINRRGDKWVISEIETPELKSVGMVEAMAKFRADLAMLNEGKWPAAEPATVDAKKEAETKPEVDKSADEMPSDKKTTSDAGEELTYNKRNRRTGGLKWDDIKDKNAALRVKEVVKAKVYPKPDYQALVDGGMRDVVAHIVKQAYDSIAPAPKMKRGAEVSDAALQSYITGVNRVMDGVMKWANDGNAVAKWAKAQSKLSGGSFSISELATAETLLDTVYPGGWRASREELTMLGGNKLLGALQPGYDEVGRAMKDIKLGWPAKSEAWQKQGYKVVNAETIDVELYSMPERGDRAPYVSVMVTANSQRIDNFIVRGTSDKESPQVQEAVAEKRKQLEGNYVLVDKVGRIEGVYQEEGSAIEAAREKVKRESGEIKEVGRKVSEVGRKGIEHRLPGDDVSSERLKETFGFRGVNFGNWMQGDAKSKIAERQLHLNHLFDAFMDLSQLLNVPPKAMSLNGMLGIAVGAQGSGKAWAHFVPGVNEINVTRTNGAGALAHEWGHALDHYFATMGGLDRMPEPYLSAHVGTLTNRVENGKYVRSPVELANVRPEVAAQFQSIVETMTKRKETDVEYKARIRRDVDNAGKTVANEIKKITEDIDKAKDGWGTQSFAAKIRGLAERMAALDYGDGRVSIGSSEVPAVVAEIADAYKEASGVPMKNAETLGYYADHYRVVSGLLESEEARTPREVNTDYKNASNAADSKKKPYWSTKLEMFARAFDAYVVDSLAEKAAENTYLAGIEAVAPQGDERKAIGRAFDFLFAELKTKETDNGIALYNIAAPGSMSPADKAIYGMAAEGKSAAEVLKFIATASRNPFYRQLAKLLQKTGIAPSITVGDGKGWKMNAGEGNKYAAGYNPKTDTISLFRPASAERNMLHELIHAASLKALSGKGMAAAQMNALFAHVEKNGRAAGLFYDQKTKRGVYGMANVEEFMAEAFSNPKFQEQLKKIAAPQASTGKLSSAWDWFVRVVRGILGMPKGQENALSWALEIGVDVMREDMAVRRAENLPETASIAERNDYVNRAIEQWAAGELEAGTVISLGNPSAILRRFGVPDLPIQIEQGVLAKAVLEKHDLSAADMKDITINIQAPIAIFKSKVGDNKIIVVTEIRHRDGNVIAALHLGAKRNRVEINDIRSIHPKRDASIAHWIEDGLLLGVDKHKGRDWLENSAGSNSRQYPANAALDKAIIYDGRLIRKAAEAAVIKYSKANDRRSWATDDIRYNVADEGWSVSEPSKMDGVIYALQDKHIDTKRVVQAIMGAGKKIRDSFNPYLQEELFHGRAAKGVKDFLDLELRPLLKQMQDAKVDMGDFEEYLWNRHAEERNKQIAKINPDMPDGGSGIETAKARAYLAGLSADQRSVFESLAAKVDAINRNSQRVLVESGLEKQSTIDAWNGAYKHYVPLQREDVDTGHVGTGKGFSVRGSSSKRAMGSGKTVVDIIANLTMQRERNIVRAEKNRVSNALMGLAMENPNPDFWKVDQAPKERVVQEKAIYTVVDAAGNKLGEFTRMDEAERLANNTEGATIDQTWGDRVNERVVPGFTSRDNVILTRVNGEDHYIIFNERDERAMRMAAAMKNLDVDNLGRVLSLVGKATRYLASINTQYNPVFGVINLIRDAQGALLNLSSTPLAGEQKRVMGYTKDALVGIYKDIRAHRAGKVPSSNWAALFEEFQKEGGQTGYRDQYANAEARAESIQSELAQFKEGKAKQLTRGLFGWLSDYNETMENAVRLAAYKAAKEKGMSKQQAASLAKNITVNFNRKGQMATQVGALYAFFNASVQGTARIAETLFDMKDGNIRTARLSKTGKKIVLGGIMLGSMQALLLAAAGYDDDEPPEFVRERNLILPIGDGKYLTLAMPLGFHVLPGIGRIATEFVASGGKDPAKRAISLLSMFSETFNPVGSSGLSIQTLTPSVVDPFAALAENRDFTGREIYRENFNANDPTPGHARAKDVATVWSRYISKAINFITGGTEFKPGAFSPSPDAIDYLIAQAGGGVMREMNKVAQTASATYTGDDLPLYKIPLVGRFVGDTEGQSGQSQKFYNAVREINQHERQIKGLREAGRIDEAREYMAENPVYRMAMLANRTESQVRKLRDIRRAASESGDSDKVRAINEQITGLVSRFNERAAPLLEQ